MHPRTPENSTRGRLAVRTFVPRFLVHSPPNSVGVRTFSGQTDPPPAKIPPTDLWRCFRGSLHPTHRPILQSRHVNCIRTAAQIVLFFSTVHGKGSNDSSYSDALHERCWSTCHCRSSLADLPFARLVDRGRSRALTPSRQPRAVQSPVSHLHTKNHSSCPHRTLRPYNNSIAPTVLPPSFTTDSAMRSMTNNTSNVVPNLGNDPPEESSPTRARNNRELRELRKKEKKARDFREKFEVRYHPHLFQRYVVLIPS